MATALDVSRETNGIDLTPEESAAVWTKAEKQSVIMQAAQRMTLPGRGTRVNILDDDHAAQWIDETAPAPVYTPKFSHRTIGAHKMACFTMFSKEFVRDRAALYSAVVQRGSQAIARAIDEAVLTGATVRPSKEDFDILYDAQTVSLGSNPDYKKLAKIYGTIANNDGNLDKWLLSPQAISTLIGMTDANGRPLITSIDASSAAVGNILGGTVLKSPWGHKAGETTGTGSSAQTSAELLGVAGDFSNAFFGMVNGIRIELSDQAAIEQGGQVISMWQRDMVAVKITAEVGFACKDKSKFVVITA